MKNLALFALMMAVAMAFATAQTVIFRDNFAPHVLDFYSNSPILENPFVIR